MICEPSVNHSESKYYENIHTQKTIYWSHTIPIKSQTAFFKKNKKAILKFLWTTEDLDGWQKVPKTWTSDMNL